MAHAVRSDAVTLRAPWALVAVLPVALGLAVGTGNAAALLIIAIPLVVLLVRALGGPGRWIAVLIALGSGMFGEPLTEPLPGLGAGVWLSDLLVGAVVAGFALEWLLHPSHERPRLPRTALLGLPMLLLVTTLMIGAARGHARYDATLIGMPLRLAAYAGIIFALPGLTPARALRGITITMYLGAVYLALSATYHVATGTSATSILNLSTGGIRYLGVAAATYAAATLILAVLNLAFHRGHPLLHLFIALLSGYAVIVAYTRTVWLVLTLVLLVAAIASPAVRGALLGAVPIVAPVLALGVILVVIAAPNLVGTLTERVSTPASQDTSVQWRGHAYKAVLSGTQDEPLLGVGFGRETSFSLNGQPNYITGDPHNGFIYVYAGAGILGLVSLILLLATSLYELVRRWRSAEAEGRTLVAWAGCTWLLLIVHSASEPLFTTPSMILTLWVVMLLPTVVPLVPAVRRRVAPVPTGPRSPAAAAA